MNSIRRRLTIQLLVVVAALTLLGNLVLYFRVRMALKHEYDSGLLSRAGALSHLIAWDENGKMMLEIPEKALEEFNRPLNPEYFEVWRPDGTPFLISSGLKGKNPWNSPPPPAPHFWYLSLPDGRDGRAAVFRFVPHRESDEPQPPGDPATRKAPVEPPPGEATLVLASDMSGIDSFLGHLIEAQLIGTILLALITTLVVVLAIRRSLRPLENLGHEADALPANSLDRRFSDQYLPLELQPIVRRLNDLLARIEEAFRRERRFTSNVAHELRTPITELRTLAEVAISCSRADGGECREFQETLAIARQMQALVESLLAIARAESPQVSAAFATEALEPLVHAALRPYLAAAAERKQVIQCRIEPGEFATDRVLFEPMLRNLIANAVAHAPPGTEIVIHARAPDHELQIDIENTAPDLTPADIARFAEPFWRKDAARSPGEHAGLGFPLALAYARNLGLVISPALSGGRLTVTLASARPGPTPHPHAAAAV